MPKVYQTIPGVYQKWRKFKYSCTARTLCSISTDTGNSYWYHPCSCALCGLPKVYSWIPTVYLNSELRFPVFTLAGCVLRIKMTVGLASYRRFRSKYTLSSHCGPLFSRRVDRSIPTVDIEFGSARYSAWCALRLQLYRYRTSRMRAPA